jgi:hypothetical protein
VTGWSEENFKVRFINIAWEKLEKVFPRLFYVKGKPKHENLVFAAVRSKW